MRYLISAAGIAGTQDELRARLALAADWDMPRREIASAVMSGLAFGFARRSAILGDHDDARRRLRDSLVLMLHREPPPALLDLRMAEIAPPEAVAAPAVREPRATADAPDAGLRPAAILARDTIGPALADFPVNDSDGHGGFAFAERDGRFLCSYFDADRQMVLACRDGDGRWSRVMLDQRIDWDSHNYIAMALDAQGLIHLCGNMHVAPLVYYRSRAPLDIGSMERIAAMTGAQEDRVTYPKFFTLPDGGLHFSYRDGSSGKGNTLVNRFDAGSLGWSRVSSAPLLDGEGIRNAYVHGPVIGPDGAAHICWVWRGTSEAETTHGLAYARSHDLVHWETGDGRPLSLPIRAGEGDIVDDLPPGSGMINNNALLGFDSAGRPLVTWHKFDAQGNTQLFMARRDFGGWSTRQLTRWPYRWDFSGRGSLAFEISLLPPYRLDRGLIAQEYHHRHLGRGTLILSEETLEPLADPGVSLSLPDELWPGPAEAGETKSNIAIHWPEITAQDSYRILAWTSRPENRDLAQAGGDTAHIRSDLEVLEIRKGSVTLDGRADAAPAPADARSPVAAALAALRAKLMNAEARLDAERLHARAVEARYLALHRSRS